MAEPTLVFSTRNLRGRVGLLAVAVTSLLFVWFAVRWQIGNMLGQLTPLADPAANQIAEVARSLAPSDPLPAWLAATKQKELFQPESVNRSTMLFQDVVRLSPYDFRWWIELGRQYEQAERTAEAEQAFKRAVELAPEYTFPRWQIGNFYLRQNRVDEAFIELRRATEKSVAYREQVFSLAWDFFEQDAAKVEQIAADSPDVRVTLASFFAQRERPDNALRIWNTLDSEQKASNLGTARVIAHVLHNSGSFRQSLEFARDSGIDPKAAFATVTNGSFEEFIGPPEETLFGWRVNRGESRMDVLPDSSVKTDGIRGLRVSFKGYQKPDIFNISQFVAVEPGATYRLSFVLRTENLRSGGPPALHILNARDSSLLSGYADFPNGTSDWQKLTVDFNVPETTDGITIVTRRVYCGEECPITGTFWYDDFVLSRR